MASILTAEDLVHIKHTVLTLERQEISRNIEPSRFFGHLRAKYIFDERDCDEIRSVASRVGSAEVFVDTLKRKGGRGYDEFCNALMNDKTQMFLLQRLTQTLELLRAKVIERKKMKLELQQRAVMAQQHPSHLMSSVPPMAGGTPGGGTGGLPTGLPPPHHQHTNSLPSSFRSGNGAGKNLQFPMTPAQAQQFNNTQPSTIGPNMAQFPSHPAANNFPANLPPPAPRQATYPSNLSSPLELLNQQPYPPTLGNNISTYPGPPLTDHLSTSHSNNGRSSNGSNGRNKVQLKQTGREMYFQPLSENPHEVTNNAATSPRHNSMPSNNNYLPQAVYNRSHGYEEFRSTNHAHQLNPPYVQLNSSHQQPTTYHSSNQQLSPITSPQDDIPLLYSNPPLSPQRWQQPQYHGNSPSSPINTSSPYTHGINNQGFVNDVHFLTGRGLGGNEEQSDQPCGQAVLARGSNVSEEHSDQPCGQAVLARSSND